MKKTTIRVTPVGPVVVIWSLIQEKPKVTTIVLSRPGQSASNTASALFPEAETSRCPAIDSLCSDIAASLGGQRICFSLGLTDMDRCPSFQQSVLRAAHAIPCGSVTTYRRLAHHLSKPGAARAVGSALANNPFPIIVPCHRVIRSDRAIGDYQGGQTMKRALLMNEGITFDHRGRVTPDCNSFISSI